MSSVRRSLTAWALAGALAGCATTTAPPGFLRAPASVPRTAYGGWVEVALGPAAAPRRGTVWAAGELLAVTADSLYLLQPAGVTVIPAARATSARVMGWDAQAGLVGSWTLGGVLLTVSNGFWLVFSAPAWIIVGSASAASQSRAPLVEVRAPGDFLRLRLYARFPQGLPPGLDRTSLRLPPPVPRPPRS